MGAMVDRGQMQRVLDYIGTGNAEGARLTLGGKQVLAETGGFYIEPTCVRGRAQRDDHFA
jgi:acyl-CoA reductase-like NAD-dependent aldehyde dehydrogenase